MVIQHNIPAMNSHRVLGINNKSTSNNLEKLSSGYRINRAGDDAAGLAISEKMRGQIRGLAMAETNASNGISLIQTAEGGLDETHAILQRMRELAVQSANGTYMDDVDRENIAKESEALKSEINRISAYTNYNGIKLLDGSMGGVKVGDVMSEPVVGSAKIANLIRGFGFNSATDTLTLDDKFADDLAGSEGKLIINDSGDVTLQIGDKTYSLYNGTPAAGLSAKQSFYTVQDGVEVAVAALSSAFFAKNGTVGNEIVTGVITFKFNNSSASGKDNCQVVLNDNDNYIATKDSQLIFQIGANGAADQRVGLHVDNMSACNLGGGGTAQALKSNRVSDVDVSTREKSNESIRVLDAAINQASGTRADLGALQNRLEHTLTNLGVTKENLQAAESSIRDVDMSKEMMEFTKNNILVQASQSMLAQANQLPQGILQLLR